MKPIPAACVPVLNYLRRQRRYVSVRELFLKCLTNSPTRRITDLHRLGYVEKRKNPFDGRYVQYRAKEGTR